ncbi:hypothetical protein [Lacticaseibacillus zeae]
MQLYGPRWQIEGSFRAAKQYLRLDRYNDGSVPGYDLPASQ